MPLTKISSPSNRTAASGQNQNVTSSFELGLNDELCSSDDEDHNFGEDAYLNGLTDDERQRTEDRFTKAANAAVKAADAADERMTQRLEAMQAEIEGSSAKRAMLEREAGIGLGLASSGPGPELLAELQPAIEPAGGDAYSAPARVMVPTKNAPKKAGWMAGFSLAGTLNRTFRSFVSVFPGARDPGQEDSCCCFSGLSSSAPARKPAEPDNLAVRTPTGPPPR